MISQHKKPATIGVVLWFALPVLFVGFMVLLAHYIPDQRAAVLVPAAFCLAAQYFAFFWGGGHLAKGKGYSSGMLLPGIFWVPQFIVLVILLFALPDKCSNPMRARSKKSDRHESRVARVVRFRRNAFVANGLGCLGILLALAVMFLPLGLFEHRDNARVAAIFIFIPSYAAVINGCWWWVRAKSWSEEVLLIGLMPLAILLVPYVRLIYVAAPLLLPASMAMMPIIMIGVIAVLPDKSGLPQRKPWDRD